MGGERSTQKNTESRTNRRTDRWPIARVWPVDIETTRAIPGDTDWGIHPGRPPVPDITLNRDHSGGEGEGGWRPRQIEIPTEAVSYTESTPVETFPSRFSFAFPPSLPPPPPPPLPLPRCANLSLRDRFRQWSRVRFSSGIMRAVASPNEFHGCSPLEEEFRFGFAYLDLAAWLDRNVKLWQRARLLGGSPLTFGTA